MVILMKVIFACEGRGEMEMRVAGSNVCRHGLDIFHSTPRQINPRDQHFLGKKIYERGVKLVVIRREERREEIILWKRQCTGRELVVLVGGGNFRNFGEQIRD